MTLVVWDRFHRGDRVRLVEGGGVGIVEGWKHDPERVLVWWGTGQLGEVRTWHPRYALEIAR